MKIYIEKTVPVRVKENQLKRIIKEILISEGERGGDLTVILVDEAYISKLNRRFRGRKETTDVLAFGMMEGEESPATLPLWGDIYVSAERARRQAKEFGVTFDFEVARLVIHGVLHLLGYTHKKKSLAVRMQQKEEEFLERWKAIKGSS